MTDKSKLKIRATNVNGEIHISLNTLKYILTSDLVGNLEAVNENIPILTSTEYIKDFIDRIEKIADTFQVK